MPELPYEKCTCELGCRSYVTYSLKEMVNNLGLPKTSSIEFSPLLAWERNSYGWCGNKLETQYSLVFYTFHDL